MACRNPKGIGKKQKNPPHYKLFTKSAFYKEFLAY